MVEVYDFKGNPMTSNMTMPFFSDYLGKYTVKGIPPGSYKVHFTPRMPSSASGQWYRNKMGFAAADTVAVTAPGDTANVTAVLGDGPDIHVTPPAKDFGTVTVNTSSVRSFTIVSDGTSDLTLGTIAITGSNTANFSLKNDLCSGKTLPPSTIYSSTSCSFQVQFSPQSVGVKNASISIPSNDPDTQTTVISLTGYGDPGPTAVLCVTMSGTGGGSVHTDPPGISCTSGKCCAPFDLGDQVTMMAKPDVYSIFGGWSGTGAGTCAGHTGDCSLTVNGASDLTATFNLMSPVRIFSATPAYYTKLQNAYDAAQEGATIQAMAHDFTETLDFNHSGKVRLTGGYDGSYTTNAGKTVVHGTLIIRQGTVTVENLLIE